MPDGSLVCFSLSGGPTEPHNDNAVFVTHSYDNGKTWSEPSESEIPNSSTKVSLLKAKNKIIMINNFRCGTLKGMSERTNLAVAVSDNGKDFKQVLFPESIDEAWYYPHGFLDEKAEKMYLAYENAKEHRMGNCGRYSRYWSY